MAVFLLGLLFLKSHACENNHRFFEEINENAKSFNSIGADIAWQSSIEPGKAGLSDRSANYQRNKIIWQHDTCRKLAEMHEHLSLNATQERQAYLLCRGPKFYYKEAREMSSLYEELQDVYFNIEVCIPDSENKTVNLTDLESAILKYISTVEDYMNFEQNTVKFAAKAAANNALKSDGLLCLTGESEFQKIMKHSRIPKVLEWVWSAWREKVQGMREPYKKLVDIENKAARRNGYTDIGDSWRDELEMPNLRIISHQLLKSIKPLYALLHGVVRFCLRREYGDIIDEKGPIPAHLLGSLWSQNWEPLADLILPKIINLDERMQNLNWTVEYMMKRAEDFYTSLGLPPMTETFWRKSVYTRDNNDLARCHGTATDMFKYKDFRLLYCSGVTFEDFYVIHHEMGHIQYYMAYEHQPALFRQANSALHESIGDTIMYGVTTPQHLNRLRLFNDSELFNPEDKSIDSVYATIQANQNVYSFNEPNLNSAVDSINNDEIKIKKTSPGLVDSITADDILIFKQALNKLPQIPFSLLMDEYRWRYFEGSLNEDALNREFWDMARVLQGIAPPSFRGEEYFDIGAKFHVPDNTPYIRYFLSSFLQHQLFESLCKAAVFGHRNAEDSLPDTISLNRCDIYGSKAAGKILKNIMSRGNSQHWQQILLNTTGKMDVSTVALKRYYRPLYKLLLRLVERYDIPIGW